MKNVILLSVSLLASSNLVAQAKPVLSQKEFAVFKTELAQKQVAAANAVQDLYNFVNSSLPQFRASTQADMINLTALTKSKGYDPKIYAQIVAADRNVEEVNMSIKYLTNFTNQLNQMVGTITTGSNSFAATNTQLSNIDTMIANIQSEQAQVPDTFPGKCVNYHGDEFQGRIDPPLIVGGLWSFQPFSGVPPYSIDKSAGIVGEGGEWIKSRSAQSKVMLDTFEVNGKQVKRVVCIYK